MRNAFKLFAQRQVLKAMHRMGYHVVRYRRPRETGAYWPVSPRATYSPWYLDQEFLAAYDAIKDNTLVDLYRCWELWTLTEQATKVPGSILEVGAWRGGSGALIALKARGCGIRDTVYLCDTFRGVVKAGANDPGYVGGEHADTSRQIVESLVHGRLKLDNVRILEGIFPDETAALVEDERFRMCHIDVDAYESARGIVQWIDSRMAVGGIYVYDDYGFEGTAGITRFVDEQRSLPDRIVLHNLNGHAIVVRIA